MLRSLVFILVICLVTAVQAQTHLESFPYEVSDAHPHGLLNPEAPAEVADFAPLIGTCQCKSVSRIDQTTWADTTNMIWTWKYIMNGTAVQDETLKEDGSYAGSIRQFIADSSHWYVHYYSSSGPTPVLPAWEGNKVDDKIILYRDQTAPNGMEGFYKITFSDMTEEGFNWLGEWVSVGETFSYPTWYIFCRKLL